jgi:hypothetical protein
MNEGGHLNYLNVGGRIILKWVEVEREVVSYILLVQNRDQWRALLDTIMNLWGIS